MKTLPITYTAAGKPAIPATGAIGLPLLGGFQFQGGREGFRPTGDGAHQFRVTLAQQQPFSHTLFAEAAAGLGHVTFVGSSGDRPNWFSAGFNFGTCRC